MPRLEFSELSEEHRVRLSESGEQELWHRVDEFGGVKSLAEAFDYSQSKIYNWKSKDLAFPVGFVRRVMGQNSTSEVKMLKGPGSGGGIREPVFPMRISGELLTRASYSVKLNSEGTPFYMASERSLVERFTELLGELGEVEYSIYSRSSRFEVRYPKFLHRIFLSVDFEENLGALVDEKGKIQEGKILLEDREIPVEDFDADLYSREKSFELALLRGDSEKIAEMMAEESEKVRELVSR
ncbi:MAG: hypothetical protein ABEJ95_02480 [Candidatus Nanohalobium sp.]